MSTIREAARGQTCTLRLPGVCSGDPGTTVLAHPPICNGGMALKGADIDGSFACANCHDVVDGRAAAEHLSTEDILWSWIRASQETRGRLVRMGLIRHSGESTRREVGDDEF
ncbi:nuclease domain-containing protein [Thioalkalivibrio sp. ARh3]|uniref:nuclease domain-containing protein n=1 Tax=Thioalkalivibrio sp. ARh3 TaxID=1158148 RepID=UPI00036C815A|nr:nuclease domain-containing protein [Thioalkalivibrio sp. ARh3]